jgi:hypothetical protein
MISVEGIAKRPYELIWNGNPFQKPYLSMETLTEPQVKVLRRAVIALKLER